MSAISAIIASEIVSENHAESQWMAERIRPERTVRSDRKTCPNRSTWNHLNTRKNLQTARQSIRSILNLEESPKRELSSPPPPYPTPPLLLHPNVAHSQLEWTGNDTIIERPFLQKSRVTITSHFDLAQISIWFVKKEETKHETKQQQKGGKKW